MKAHTRSTNLLLDNSRIFIFEMKLGLVLNRIPKKERAEERKEYESTR